MGRRLNWLLYGTPPSPRSRSSPPATAGTIEAAARVALARRRGRGSLATTPFGFGPPLAGFEPPYPFTAPGWFDRSAAMSVASISRSRDLICSAVSALPFTLWQIDRQAVPAVERRIPDYTWMDRPDPDRTRQWMLSWTTDDLMFHAAAHWHITARFATGFPSQFRRIEPGDLHDDGDGALSITDPYTGERVPVRDEDIVEFLSPIEGMLSNGWRTISIAMQLDEAADRFASNEIPNGWLQEKEGSEDLADDELQKIALDFSVARHTATTAALNKWMDYHPNTVNPDDMQLVDSRSYQALEAARLGNVPPYLVGAPAGTGMTYQNGQQARQDLVDFGAAAFIGCIEQTLSGPNVTPRGTAVRLDLNAWLRNPFTTSSDGEPAANDLQVADPSPDQAPTQTPPAPPTEVAL